MAHGYSVTLGQLLGERMSRVDIMARHLPRLEDFFFISLTQAVHGAYKPQAAPLGQDWRSPEDRSFENRMSKFKHRGRRG